MKEDSDCGPGIDIAAAAAVAVFDPAESLAAAHFAAAAAALACLYFSVHFHLALKPPLNLAALLDLFQVAPAEETDLFVPAKSVSFPAPDAAVAALSGSSYPLDLATDICFGWLVAGLLAEALVIPGFGGFQRLFDLVFAPGFQASFPALLQP